jgi:hypothetical protein
VTEDPGPADVVVVVVAVEVAPPGKVYDALVSITVTRKYQRRIGMMAATSPTKQKRSVESLSPGL